MSFAACEKSFACLRLTMQLTTEQRVFLMTEWTHSGSLQQVAQAFRQRFPDRNGRLRSVRTEDNVAAVQQQLGENPHVSAKRNDDKMKRVCSS